SCRRSPVGRSSDAGVRAQWRVRRYRVRGDALAHVGKLYEDFSHIQRMAAPARERLLWQLMKIAATQFGGRVERNVISPIYLARRR
ncbi:MAG TPA: hypothetical protein VFG38_06710, partial [Pseudomonadales bacterium]|nr:hypothetical protein [Pseudomonadales bacterium]